MSMDNFVCKVTRNYEIYINTKLKRNEKIKDKKLWITSVAIIITKI